MFTSRTPGTGSSGLCLLVLTLHWGHTRGADWVGGGGAKVLRSQKPEWNFHWDLRLHTCERLMSSLASSRCCRPTETLWRTSRQQPPEGIPGANPSTEQMIPGATPRSAERLQTCQHLQLINVTRCLFLKSHPRTAEEEAP